MTLIDWVALGMLWWKGGGRAAIVRWLVEPGGARQMAVLSGANLETVTRAIDPSLARPGRLARARMAAESALETARAAGITVVPWSDIRYPTALSANADPASGSVDTWRAGCTADLVGRCGWLARRLRLCSGRRR